MGENVKHTPGPWIEAPRSAGAHIHANRGEIAWLRSHMGIPSDEIEGNARLIAAAPDLLEALKEVMAVLRQEAPGTPLNNHRFDALGVKAYDAIAKAEARP